MACLKTLVPTKVSSGLLPCIDNDRFVMIDILSTYTGRHIFTIKHTIYSSLLHSRCEAYTDSTLGNIGVIKEKL